jgi:formylglycine-generating enzyme required for sulfatase activity/dienelactone hydrolase
MIRRRVGGSLARFSDFIAELKRRRVFRALLGWGIGAFAVLQVIEPVLHAYHLPEWTLTAAVTLLATGFPAAAILAWIFDFTAKGVTLTPALPAEAPAGAAPPAGKVVLSRRTVALLAGGAVVAIAVGAWLVRRESRIRWALEEGLPQVAELAEQGKYPAAVALAERVEQVIPRNPRLLKLWPEMSRLYDVETVPDGAEIRVKGYGAPDAGWRLVGRSPVKGVRLPIALHQWRVEKPGFTRLEVVPRIFGPAGATSGALRFALDQEGRIPPDMVHVPGGSVSLEIPGLDHLPPVNLGDFLIDRTEVTNAQFKLFVDAGGYRRPEFWKQGFTRNGRELSFDQAMALFRDRTGRAGPATWESGDHPDGQGNLPVTGVSWHEAAAYAVFAGKALPNVYQWSLAAGAWASSQIVPLSNFRGTALAPVATHEGVGPYGTRDMAGNAKEWCWNASGDKRFILGGAWNEPSYMFNDVDAQAPFGRAPNYGFRLVRPLGGETDLAAAAPIPWALRDYRREKPVREEAFRTFKRLYAYDPAPLEARAEGTDDRSDAWRKEKVSFAAAYGGERVVAYLFTPRRGAPPFQTVVYFPGSNAIHQRSSEELPGMRIVSPVVKSGRALLYPVYKSTFERGDALKSDYPAPTAFYRDHVIMWAKDLGRAIDYVTSRQDLDASRIALYGLSWGAELAPLLAAVDDRIKVGILVGGGFGLQQVMPEADPFHFAPHVRQPMLMVNGRYDFFFPYDTTQLPLFQLLGTPSASKRHVVFEAGHVPPNELLTKEVLDWMDRYLGPVR